MEIIGIICEYNPFHNGHIYHINKIKEMYPESIVILVMSGNVTERGEFSLINKWDKTKIVLNYNIDLVVELPFVFASQAADIFSHGALEILNELRVNKLIFGSECNDINTLTEVAKCQINNEKFDNLVKKYLDEGINYPTSLSKAIQDITNINIKNPNDLLGVSYIKEILKNNYNIESVTIKRTNDYHSMNLDSNIASASSIRSSLNNNIDIKNYVPIETYEILNNKHDLNNYFSLIKYKILSSIDELDRFQTVDEGISNRIKKYIYKSNSLDELINNIKTKRYTYNKIRRMIIHILCNFTKEEAKSFKNIEYIRILGFNKIGQKYLNKIKKETSVPLITKYNGINSKILELEFRVNTIYASVLNEEEKLFIIESEYKTKPIIK